MKMWTWPYPLSTWRYIGEYLYRDESGHEEDRITEANPYMNVLFKKTKLAKLKDDTVSRN